MLLKLQLHFHTNKDPKDTFIDYSPKQAIDIAYRRGFNVLSFTHHLEFIFEDSWKNYALEKGILLIPGVEFEIEKKHILIYNPDKDIKKVKTFDELREYKKYNPYIKIVAPHPFYFGKICLRNKLLENIDIFDGIEFSSLYMKRFGNKANKKAVQVAKQFDTKLIGNADVHKIDLIEDTYSVIDFPGNLFDERITYKDKVNKFLSYLFDKNTDINIISSPYNAKKLLKDSVFFFLQGRTKRYIKYIFK